MAKVLGVGGVFFKAKDPAALGAWYAKVLGIEAEDWGGTVFRPDAMAAHPGAATVFSAFPADTDYFEPSTKDFMINLAVDDLDAILAMAREHGVEPVRSFDDQSNGRFVHIVDPEGTTIELWQPKPMA
jgi:predicted enzyme related to lactoylglutathione lyase